jgi:hypothetical protein
MIDPEHYGLIEMGFTGAVVLAFAFYQLWSVRDAGKDKAKDASAKDPGHPEG